MKRDEKNALSRRRIIDSALTEFGNQGYGLSSVNSICTMGDISKGILYHYFKDKDTLYLACVTELFDNLTAHLTQELADDSGTEVARLERYFEARLSFFHGHFAYHQLFCDMMMSPPQQLEAEIMRIRAPFDQLNSRILMELLHEVKLRGDVTIESVVETFRVYQDFVNARCKMVAGEISDIEEHERTCKRSIDILLYGIVERCEK